MTHVRALRGLHRVVVDIDDAVQIARNLSRDFEQLIVVEITFLRLQRTDELLHLRATSGRRRVVLDNESWERDGSQVADRRFLRARELHNLGAQVGRLDRAEVLLVGLAVARILEEHVRVTSFHLRLENREPQLLRLDGFLALAFGFVLLVEGFEFLTPAIGQARALIRAHQRPITVRLDALHEQVVRPQPIEEIASARFFFAVILAKVKPVEDVRVPRFDVDGESTLALAATLVDVTRRVVEHTQHRDDAVGRTVRAANIRACGANVVNGQTNAASGLGDARALLQGIVDTFDGVFFHGNQEARRKLRARRTSVEQRRRRVRHPAFAEHVIRVDGLFNILLVDAYRHAHEQVLRAFDHLTIDSQQIRALKSLVTEVIVLEVAIVHNLRVETFGVRLDDFVHVVGEQR
mmetsp:Transcript_2175/g.8519  ORF Transcript_2175/g.8519 Transcript_2175/m.8519 type:complete len:408 (+) Transcript_2175:256-1479(+)